MPLSVITYPPLPHLSHQSSLPSPEQAGHCQEGDNRPLTGQLTRAGTHGAQPGVGVQAVSVQVDDVARITQPRLVPGERPHVVVSVGLQSLQVVDTTRLWNTNNLSPALYSLPRSMDERFLEENGIGDAPPPPPPTQGCKH